MTLDSSISKDDVVQSGGQLQVKDYIEKNYVLDQNYHSQDNLSESNVKVYRRNQGR